MAEEVQLTVKYLSSPKLLRLQLQDAALRRHFLVQVHPHPPPPMRPSPITCLHVHHAAGRRPAPVLLHPGAPPQCAPNALFSCRVLARPPCCTCRRLPCTGLF